MDGWSGGDAQYVAVYATFPSSVPCGYENVLLSHAPMGDEETFTAQGHYNFIKFIFSVYDKTMDKMLAIVGDNENTKFLLVSPTERFGDLWGLTSWDATDIGSTWK